MQRLIKFRPRRGRGWLALLVCLGIFTVIYAGLATLAKAEGSRDLYPVGVTGNRANIEWRNSFYGAFLRRRSLFQVYAKTGEVILLGSSAVGVEKGDIRVYDPQQVTGIIGDENIPDTPDFSCEAQRNSTGNGDQGRITSRAMELAGPDTITDSLTAAPGNVVADGYTPCFYTAQSTGIYHVVFLGPEGDDSDAEIAPTGEVELISPDNFNEQQGTSVAAWDVTVRSELSSTDDFTGRLFVDYLTRFTGGWPRPTSSTYFIFTNDGYLYQTDTRGIDANGFVVYANNIGFSDSDGSLLYHNVVSDPSAPQKNENQLNDLLGGVSLAPPSHLIFFNRPNQEAIEANGFQTVPTLPEIDSLQFEGRLGDDDTFVTGGGTFTFTTNISGVFELVISRDGLDFSPDNPLNRTIRAVYPTPGINTAEWDGSDNTGDPFPVGQGYVARLIGRGGEHHFPMLDVEGSLEGGPTFTLLNPPGGTCPSFEGEPPSCTTGFYDDRGYTTANGTDVEIPGQVLSGNNPPDTPNSNPLTGFDTTSNQRQFGDGTANGFGDAKGMDLWTFFPSEPQQVAVDILPLNVALGKSDNGISVVPGGVITYTLTYTNSEQVNATGVIITDVVPLYTTFNAAASVPTQWSCPDGSPAGTVCITQIGALSSGESGSVNFGVTVALTIPDSVTQIDNLAIIGEDGSHGPEPEIDNQDSEKTPLQLVTPTPTTVPDVAETPASVPSREPDNDDDDDDDDNDDDDDGGNDDSNRDTVVSTPPTSSTPTGQSSTTQSETPTRETLQQATATPAIPVVFLPETGFNEPRPTNELYTFVIGLGAILLLAFLWIGKNES